MRYTIALALSTIAACSMSAFGEQRTVSTFNTQNSQQGRGIGIGLQGSGTTIGPQSSQPTIGPQFNEPTIGPQFNEPTIGPQFNEPAIGQQGSIAIQPGLSDQGLIMPGPNTIVVSPAGTPTFVPRRAFARATPPLGGVVTPQNSPLVGPLETSVILPGLSDQGLIFPAPNTIVMARPFSIGIPGHRFAPVFGRPGFADFRLHGNSVFVTEVSDSGTISSFPNVITLSPQFGIGIGQQGFGTAIGPQGVIGPQGFVPVFGSQVTPGALGAHGFHSGPFFSARAGLFSPRGNLGARGTAAGMAGAGMGTASGAAGGGRR